MITVKLSLSRLNLFPVVWLLLLFVFASCAPTSYEVTSGLLEQGKNDEAIGLARVGLAKEPDDPLFLKYLGMGLYNKKYYAEAEPWLNRSVEFDPEDDQAVYYLASCYEAVFDYPHAIQYYRKYEELTIFGEYRDIVEAKIKLLYRQQMDIEAKAALVEESRLDVAAIPTNTLAVLYFENKGNMHSLDPLQKGIAEMMITDFSKVHSIRVVERLRLQKLMEELNFSETNLVDERTAPRMGKLLGAYHLVKGTFFDLTSEKMRIDALVARTRTGDIDGVTDISGNMTEFFRLEKELVFKILDELKITISDSERESILEIPTENFFAFLQYSQGLDYEDRGLYTQAVQSYTGAVQADPKFSQAKSSLASAQKTQQLIQSSTPSGTQSVQAPAPAAVPPPPSSSAIKESVGAVSERVSETTTNVTTGFVPGPSSTAQAPSVTTPLPAPPQPPK
ncbi:MAG TPA: tetratricopeptide repeat protein [Bacteroidota bacterium]|nr:tetratricopeptide repeat protein [Bacteroidota bacterium]